MCNDEIWFLKCDEMFFRFVPIDFIKPRGPMEKPQKWAVAPAEPEALL
jgi:hypothetical protein